MMLRAAELFGNTKKEKEKMQYALEVEDYEDEGCLTLIQIKEAIQSEYENKNPDEAIIDYLLYYCYIRSQSDDKMEYKHIITLLTESAHLQERASGDKRKPRPESSSPEKLKKRNPPSTGAGIANLKGIDDSDSEYSEVNEI